MTEFVRFVHLGSLHKQLVTNSRVSAVIGSFVKVVMLLRLNTLAFFNVL